MNRIVDPPARRRISSARKHRLLQDSLREVRRPNLSADPAATSKHSAAAVNPADGRSLGKSIWDDTLTARLKAMVETPTAGSKYWQVNGSSAILRPSPGEFRDGGSRAASQAVTVRRSG